MKREIPRNNQQRCHQRWQRIKKEAKTMATLADVYRRLDQMGVEPEEIRIPSSVFNYIIQIAEDILAEEDDTDDD